MITWSIIAIVFLISWSIIYFQLKWTPVYSDHKLNLSCVYQVKHNGNRFINERQDSLFNKGMVYPQLLYWVWSLLPIKTIKRYSVYTTLLFRFLSSICFVIFLHFLAPYTGLPYDSFVIYASILYAFTPFTYNTENAKNLGLSGRGMGLFFCEVYTYCLFLFIVSGNPILLILATFAGLLIFLSSQFAIQFLIFGSSILSILFLDWSFILVLMGSFTLFFLGFHKYAKRYIKLQFAHKRMYFKVISHSPTLKFRTSIWTQLYKDFWLDTIQVIRGRGDKKKLLKSVLTNPVIVVIVSFPTLVLMLIYTIASPSAFSELSVMQQAGAMILSMAISFILTSFNSTRFLGEPQRYIECITPFIAILGTGLFYDQPYLLHASIWVGVGLAVIQPALYVKFKLKTSGERRLQYIKSLGNKIDVLSEVQNIAAQDQRVLSNNSQHVKNLLNGERKVFWGPAISNKVGSFTYEQVFSDFPNLNEKLIPDLIKEFKINFLLLDLKSVSNCSEILGADGYQLTLKSEFSDLRLYQIDLL